MKMPSKIEWTDEVWNVVTGCTNISPGCDHCYAEGFVNRFKRHAWADVTLHPDRLDWPAEKWKKGVKIFTCSMGDLFHSAVPDEFLERVFIVMAENPQHTFQVLTKRPGRALQWVKRYWIPKWASVTKRLPSNVWMGTSVEQEWDGRKRLTARLDLLAQIPARVRFLSYEPALGPLDLNPWLRPTSVMTHLREAVHADLEARRETAEAIAQIAQAAYTQQWGLGWVIAGGESGGLARPSDSQWYQDVRDQCIAAKVPFFFKQWGEFLPVGQQTTCLSRGIAWEWKHRALVNPGPDGFWTCKYGKKDAGALLDGREWRQFPEGRQWESALGGSTPL